MINAPGFVTSHQLVCGKCDATQFFIFTAAPKGMVLRCQQCQGAVLYPEITIPDDAYPITDEPSH
jgi:hypothetical protein